MKDHKEITKQAYDKIAPQFSLTHFQHFWVEEFKNYTSLIKGNKIVDIGCGAGRDAEAFVEHGFDYTGIDASEGMLEVAKERVPKGKFKQMDFYKLGFPDNEFDGFWSSASFLHVPKNDISMVVKEARRVIKPEGIGFISVKEKTEMDEGQIDEAKYGGISRYFAFYTKDELKKILEDIGFKILKVTVHVEDDERQTNWLCFFVRK